MAVASTCSSGSGGSNWGGSSFFFGGRGLKRDCRDPESNKTLIGCESESNRPSDQGGGACVMRERLNRESEPKVGGKSQK